MEKAKLLRGLRTFLCGFLAGVAIILLLGSKEHIGIEPFGVFGDICIVKGKDPNSRQEILTFIKGDGYPFFYIVKDESGKIARIGIGDGRERPRLAEAEFKGDRLSDFTVYCEGDGPYLNIRAADKPGVWHEARYLYQKNRKFFGENYEDIDFDGHFDAKTVYDKNSKIIAEYIFINDIWQEVSDYYPDKKTKNKWEARALYINGKYQHINVEDKEQREKIKSLPSSVKEKIYYDFEYGKGWKKRE